MVYINNTPYGTTEVHLDTRFGKKYSDYENSVVWYFAETLLRVSPAYDLVFSIISATIPITFNNIEAALENNTMNVVKIGVLVNTTITVTLEDGMYNINDVIKSINAQLKPINVSMSWSKVTGLVTFTGDASFTVQQSGLSTLLGLVGNIASNDAFVIKGSKKVDLRRTQSLFIASPELLCDSADSKYLSRSNVLCRIPLDNNIHENVVHWKNTANIMTKIHSRNVNSFHLVVLDDDRRIINLTSPWQVNLQIDIINHVDIIPYNPRFYLSNGKQVELGPLLE